MKKKAHIRKDGSPSYKQEIRINGRRITKRFTRISDAEKWYAEMKRQKELIESGLTLSIDSEMTLNEYAEIWMEKRRSQGKPLGSWLTDRERLHKWVLPLFGERLLQSIGSQELEAFMDRLVTKEGLSSTTRNRVRAVLHKLYNDAKRQGYVQVNPVSNVILWKENRDGFDYWHSLQECQAYLLHAELESPSFYVYAILALNTGARLGEILALQNQDIDLENRRIHVCKLKEYRNGEICKRTTDSVLDGRRTLLSTRMVNPCTPERSELSIGGFVGRLACGRFVFMTCDTRLLVTM